MKNYLQSVAFVFGAITSLLVIVAVIGAAFWSTTLLPDPYDILAFVMIWVVIASLVVGGMLCWDQTNFDI